MQLEHDEQFNLPSESLEFLQVQLVQQSAWPDQLPMQ